jgi:chemotaxis protein MotB
VLFDPADPLNPMNRRISILVMNRDAEDRLLRVTSDEEEVAQAAAQPTAAASIPSTISR